MRIKAIFVQMLKHFISNKNNYFKGFLLSLLIVACCTSCFKNLTKLTVVYQNDFENYDLKQIQVSGWLNGSFGPLTGINIMDYNGNKVLGRLNSSLIDLTLTELPTHTALTVEFDLYIHDNWRNDLWKTTFEGVDQILTGFSNDQNVQQAYPNWLGGGGQTFAPGTNAFTTNLPGACALINSQHGTSMYKMIRTVVHSDKTFQLQCSDAGQYFNDLCQRSWSMDNLKITLINN